MTEISDIWTLHKNFSRSGFFDIAWGGNAVSLPCNRHIIGMLGISSLHSLNEILGQLEVWGFRREKLINIPKSRCHLRNEPFDGSKCDLSVSSLVEIQSTCMANRDSELCSRKHRNFVQKAFFTRSEKAEISTDFYDVIFDDVIKTYSGVQIQFQT